MLRVKKAPLNGSSDGAQKKILHHHYTEWSEKSQCLNHTPTTRS